MKNKELFDKSVAILVKAYINDTLEVGNYCGCAVGNLISANMNIPLRRVSQDPIRWEGEYTGEEWYDAILDSPLLLREGSSAQKQIASTGYTFGDIVAIEKAFEQNWIRDIFDKLMSVVDVLCEIHEANETAKEEAKALFAKA